MIVRGGKLYAMPSETLKRIELGKELRRLRERAGLDIKDGAEVIHKSHTTMVRIENGENGIRDRDLTNLVRFYADTIGTNPDGTPTDRRDAIDLAEFLDMNKDAATRGKWRGYRGTHAAWFRRAVDMESDAEVINIYGTELFHGLLQSEEYMLALFTDASLIRDKAAAKKLRARAERQKVITREHPPHITFVLSQSCLERMVGSPIVQARQLEHVAQLAERPNIQMHVLSFRGTTWTAGVQHPFTHFRLPPRSNDKPPLDWIYVEHRNDADYLDSPAAVADYIRLWNGMLEAALDPTASHDLLLSTAQTFRHEAEKFVHKGERS
jgi:transcriptional regulator with XRE-family HTH domain